MYNVLIGNYGSGKTELSLNLALNAAKAGKRTAIVDLDIVNPYFRSAEKTALLTAAGVRMIAPPFAMTGVDLPVVSAEVSRVFNERYDEVVFDVGGDAVGAAALGRFHNEFERVRQQTDFLFVVNTKRPLAHSSEDLRRMIDVIQRAARISITGFIHNSNLARETSAADLIEGDAVLLPLAKELGVPVKYVSGLPAVLEEYARAAAPAPAKLLPIALYMRPDWLDISELDNTDSEDGQ